MKKLFLLLFLITGTILVSGCEKKSNFLLIDDILKQELSQTTKDFLNQQFTYIVGSSEEEFDSGLATENLKQKLIPILKRYKDATFFKDYELIFKKIDVVSKSDQYINAEALTYSHFVDELDPKYCIGCKEGEESRSNVGEKYYDISFRKSNDKWLIDDIKAPESKKEGPRDIWYVDDSYFTSGQQMTEEEFFEVKRKYEENENR